MKTVIFDLDNCLADDEHRIPLIDWSATNPEQRYAAYHAACGDDHVGNHAAVRRFASFVDKFVFFTARPCAVREKTEHWIRTRLGCEDFILVMRNNGDHRSSLSLKQEMLQQLVELHHIPLASIIGAYDDREDIVEMYKEHGIKAGILKIHDVCAYSPPAAPQSPEAISAADILLEMSNTFRERNKVYGDNYKMVAKLMAVLFPNGVPPELVVQDHFHLFELVLVKLSRYAISNLTHIDSAHDGAVYLAMCEAFNRNTPQGTKQ